MKHRCCHGAFSALFLSHLLLLLTPSALAQQQTAFLAANIWTGQLDAALSQAVLLVEDGRVVDLFVAGEKPIPDGFSVLDLGDVWLIPGLVNAHGHIGRSGGFHVTEPLPGSQAVQSQLELYASYGVTSVFSMGGEPVEAFDWRASSRTSEHSVARLFVGGQALAPDTAEQARAMVSSSLALQPDYLKIRVDSFLGRNQKMPVDVYRALIEAAAAENIRVVSHMVELEDARSLLDAGSGLLAHSVRDQSVDAEFIGLMAASGVCLTPTLMREVSTFVFASRPEFFDDHWFLQRAPASLIEQLLLPETQARYDNESARWYRDALPLAVANMMAIHRGGGTIAMGTDTGVGQRFQGYFEQLEMEMMQQAGMTAREVLTASSLNAARCLGKEHLVGSLQAGTWADFLVLAQNPLDDVAAIRSLQAVYIGGRQAH